MGLDVTSSLVVGALATRHKIKNTVTKYNVDTGAPHQVDVVDYEWRIGEFVVPVDNEDYDKHERLVHQTMSEGSGDAVVGLAVNAIAVNNDSRVSGTAKLPDLPMIADAEKRARAELLALGYDGPVGLFLVTYASF